MLAFLARGAVAQKDDRGLAVKQVNSGVAPDGRGRLWDVVIRATRGQGPKINISASPEAIGFEGHYS